MTTMKNKLSDLNDHLFAQLERLANEELTPEQVDMELKRGKAIVAAADQIVKNAALQVQVASDALMHSQRVGKAAPNAVQGNTEAFAQLKDSRAQLTNDLMLLSNGGRYSSRTIPAAPANLVLPLSAARKKWSSSDNAAGTILKLEPELAGFDKSLRALDTLSPELLTMTEDLLTQKVTRGGSAYELPWDA